MSRVEQLISEGLGKVQAHRIAHQEAEIRRHLEQRGREMADACRASYAASLAGQPQQHHAGA
jgi:hypothetical protein